MIGMGFGQGPTIAHSWFDRAKRSEMTGHRLYDVLAHAFTAKGVDRHSSRLNVSRAISMRGLAPVSSAVNQSIDASEIEYREENDDGTMAVCCG